MIDKEKALSILTNIVKNRLEHQDYSRVTRYSKLLKQLVTGEDMEDLVERFALREDSELFAQRLRITQHIVKPLTRSAYRPINKISRVTPIINEISYDEKLQDKGKPINREKASQNVAELKKAMSKIYGGESIDTYLEKRFGDLSAYDPNSFLLTSFANFDSRFEKPQPYITEVSSNTAIHYEYFNNVLQYLVCRAGIKIPIKTADSNVISTQDGYEYHIYVDNDTVVFTQLDSNLYKGLLVNKATDGVYIQNPANAQDDYYGANGIVIRFNDERTFLIRYYEQKSGVVPAVRIGCVPDPLTDGRTCLSVLDNAIPYLMKTIKTVSEMDLAMSLHAFPQKIIRTPRCNGATGDKCDKGKNRAGSTCTVCKGTGKAQVSTSTQVTIELSLPEDTRNPDAMFDLEKIVHYVTLPIDILEFQNKYIEQLKADIMKAIYNSDVFTRAQIQDTATAKNIEYESVNDTLQPYGTQYSTIRNYETVIVANFLDIAAGLIVKHKFPKDYKLRSLQMMLEVLKTANDSGAPSYVKKEINRDIANNLYQDRPDELKRIEAQSRFMPFDGMIDSQIQFAISNKKCTRQTEILYYNFKDIFVALEQAAELSNQFFYDYPYEIQKSKIDSFVEKIIQAIDDQQPKEIGFDGNATPDDGGNNPDGNSAPSPNNNDGQGDQKKEDKINA